MQVLAEAGGKPQHIVRLTWYVTDKTRIRGETDARSATPIAASSASIFPAMTLMVVAGLLEPGAKVEIEATAVVPG